MKKDGKRIICNSDRHLQRNQEVLEAFRAINRLIIEETDLNKLISGICKYLKIHLGYHNAWIALTDNHDHVYMTASHGLGDDFPIMKRYLEKGSRPDCLNKAIKNNKDIFLSNPKTDCGNCPLSRLYKGRYGMTSRLRYKDEIYGIISVSLTPDIAICEHEVDYFSELCNDLSFALHKHHESKTLYLANEIFSRSQAAAFVWKNNSEWAVEYAAGSIERLFGWTIKDFLSGRISYRNLVHPEDRERVFRKRADIAEADKNRAFIEDEYRIVNRNGEILWINDLTTIQREEPNENSACQSILHDITIRKKTEKQLLEKTAEFEGIFRNSQIGIMALKGGRIFARGNQRLADILGYGSPDEMVGMNMRSLHLNEKHFISFGKKHYEKLRDNEQFQVEYRLRRKDGTPVWCSLSGKALNPENLDDGVIWIIDDIENRKQIEKKLLETNKKLEKASVRADAANKAKSDFLSNISHEIRTPLNGVIGMTDMLQHTELDKEQKHFTAIVKSCGKSLMKLVDELLDYSRIEAGKITLESADFNLVALLENIADRVALKAKEKGLELSYSTDENVPHYLVGDPDRVCQILTNLVGNAIKFTEKGSVSINASLESENKKQTVLRLTVRDTGIGIAEDALNALFDRFTQEDESIKRKYGGTGLGLAITKQLTRLMGGNIGADSQKNIGSEFWVTLPFKVQKGTREEKKDTIPHKLSGVKALLLMKNERSSQNLYSMMHLWKMNIFRALNTETALTMLRDAASDGNDPFQVILIDNDFPEQNATDIISVLEAEKTVHPLRLVLLDEADKQDENDKSLKSSSIIVEHLQRPVRMKELKKTLEHILEHRLRERTSAGHDEDRIQTHDGNENPARKILLVDDSKTNLMVASHMLKKMGFLVETAEDGVKAIDILQSSTYDLILMDLQMPNMDGYECTREIRNPSSPVLDHNVIIVALTAHSREEDRQKCLEYGMNDHLSKPVEFEVLQAALTKHLPVL